MESIETAAGIVLVGIGATALLDLWLLLLRRLGVPTLDFALIGRWVGHIARGRWFHAGIARSAPIRGELALGWIVHYAIGIGFAAIPVLVLGIDWLAEPRALPAIAIGIGTVLAPLLLMQPAMGAGIASSRTATPLRNCLRSIANHAVFGAGLYAAALARAAIA